MSAKIKRRAFLTLLGGAAAWPLAVRAQQPTVALVGLLTGFQQDDRWLGPHGVTPRGGRPNAAN